MYKQLIDLGFERQESVDTLFFDQHGYNYFWLQIELKKGYSIEWSPNLNMFNLFKYASFIGSYSDIKRTIALIEIFGKKKKK